MVGFHGVPASLCVSVFRERNGTANRQAVFAAFLDGVDHVFRADDVAKRQCGIGQSQIGTVSRRASQSDNTHSAVLRVDAFRRRQGRLYVRRDRGFGGGNNYGGRIVDVVPESI